jgi:alginate O-acetyltransferase complex protein AlgI
MIFSSYEFIFLFLPLVLAGYYLIPNRGRTTFLTLASYFFYGWWDYRFCGLMLFSTVIDYGAGIGISRALTPRGRKGWMILSVVSNLSLLGFFKYFDMFASAVNYGISALFPEHRTLNTETIPLLHLVLPVGISFYTFQSMSYAIDLYRDQAKPTRSFMDFACYVSLFPQLVAGPIVRYHELAEQLVHREHNWARAFTGCSFFILGLAKKVLVADGVAPLAEAAFGTTAPGFVDAWTGVIAYTVQIYFDFSGYSDMAVGLALLFGFQMPQNFHSPYKAVSITDFWRRWHISLSTWLRDYLYIPLGGNQRGSGRTYINLMLTMLLGGLWHGANWTFVVWGLFHGGLLALERAIGKNNPLSRSPLVLQRAITFILVMIGWVLFRATSIPQALDVYAGMLGVNGPSVDVAGCITWSLPVVMLPLSLLLVWFLPNSWQISHQPRMVWTGSLIVLFVVSVLVLLVNSASPFLYFQF